MQKWLNKVLQNILLNNSNKNPGKNDQNQFFRRLEINKTLK